MAAGPPSTEVLLIEAATGERDRLVAAIERASAAVLVCDLGARDSSGILALCQALPEARAAAVLVLPFSFERPAAFRLAEETLAELAPRMALTAVASRDEALAVAPSGSSLDEAYRIVDGIAAAGAEALAFALASDTGTTEPPSSLRNGVTALGAASSTGDDPIEAMRLAARSILLAPKVLAASRSAFAAAVARRPITLSEARATEEIMREALAPGAEIELRPREERSLGPRVLAAVCVEIPAELGRDCEFPSEDPATLEIPAFIRRRAARERAACRMFLGGTSWRKTG